METDTEKTKEELVREIEYLRGRIAELERQCVFVDEARLISERRYRALFEDSRDAVYIVNKEARFVDVNNAMIELFGYTREEMMGLSILALYVNPEDRIPIIRAMEEKGAVKDWGVRLRKKDGTKLDCLVTASLWRSAEGEMLGYQGIIRDITEHKRADMALRKSEEKFSKIFRSSPDWIAISTLDDGRLIDVNEAFLRITGYRREEVIGKTSSELNLWVDYDERAEVVKILKEQQQLRDHEVQFRMKSGEIRTMLRSAELIELDGQQCIINVTRDITERKRDEEKIRSLNRELQHRINDLLEVNKELDAFSYSVSHDLRTPLIIIGGYTQRLLKKYSDVLNTKGIDMLKVIQGNIQRMEGLINDLLAFSRSGRQQLNRTEIDMKRLVESVFRELKGTAPGRKIELRLGELPPAYADPSLLRQVMVNLLSNAFKFTRPREAAIIEVGGHRLQGAVEYYVKDNGIGFDRQHAERIFNVFQRLHSEEGFEGTGVGLSIVYRIIMRHGGRVWAEGESGVGATFHFTLPLGDPITEGKALL